MKFNPDYVFGIVRHALTFAGGIMVMSGKADETLVTETAGAVITTLGLLWSLVAKINRPKPAANEADHGFDKPGL